MGSVRAVQTFPGTVHDAEGVWYDTSRWPAWVDGLAEVSSVEGHWPQAGATVTWESGPAGRGRVVERVVDHEPLAGQTVEVQDDSIAGRQTVTFTALDGGVEVRLALEYEIKQRSIVTPLLDALFVRRAMRASLSETLMRFGAQLSAPR